MTRSTFGPCYDEKRDGAALALQRERIRDLMIDGTPRTLNQIEEALCKRCPNTRFPQSSISAQLRHLKKPEFGSYRLEKEYVGNRLYAYRLLPPLPVARDGQTQLFAAHNHVR